jgi:hypothetical protein
VKRSSDDRIPLRRSSIKIPAGTRATADPPEEFGLPPARRRKERIRPLIVKTLKTLSEKQKSWSRVKDFKKRGRAAEIHCKLQNAN